MLRKRIGVFHPFDSSLLSHTSDRSVGLTKFLYTNNIYLIPFAFSNATRWRPSLTLLTNTCDVRMPGYVKYTSEYTWWRLAAVVNFIENWNTVNRDRDERVVGRSVGRPNERSSSKQICCQEAVYFYNVKFCIRSSIRWHHMDAST